MDATYVTAVMVGRDRGYGRLQYGFRTACQMEAAPDRRLRRASARRARLPGAAYVVAAAVLWWAAATWREGTTYHLAPVVVTAGWAVADLLQRQERLTHTQAAIRLGAGTVAALAVTAGLATTGRLDGPALVGGSALAETLLATAVTIPLTWWAVTRAAGELVRRIPCSDGPVEGRSGMAKRPLVIAFDVIETLFPLQPVRRLLIEAGQPGHVLELWFARLLRDAFALVASDSYRPFGEIAASALRSTAGTALGDDAVQAILAGFAELDPHPDVAPAVRLAGEAGVRMVTLTNGSARNTMGLLQRAKIDDDIEQVLSVDDVGRWKPAPEIYRHAATSTQVPLDRVALVAAHAWDTHGAHQAGLTTGWVARLEDDFPKIFAAPDVVGRDLVEVVKGLLALPA